MKKSQQEVELIIKRLPLGPIQANCYILGCEHSKKAVVIDPGGEVDKILLALASDQLSLEYIINTHGHFDHVGGNKRLKEATGAKILIHESDAPMLSQLSSTATQWGLSSENSPPPDRNIFDGDTITCGKMTLSVIHTPGHTPGGVSLLIDNHVFVGDTLFKGSIGRTDLPGGNTKTLISSIQQKLFILPDSVVVHTGHMDESTIGTEKKYNPFCAL